MITLVRDGKLVALETLTWETLQEYAKKEGWRPSRALDPRARRLHTTYTTGRTVSARDAARLAAALEQFVNGERMDGGEIDPAPIVRIVNFLRGGAFEIR